jgi:hypothetical protein
MIAHNRLRIALIAALVVLPAILHVSTTAAGRRVPSFADGSPRGFTAAVGQQAIPALEARVVAVNIPGAGAPSPVGRFLAGGPIHDNATFAAYTTAGSMLDPERILVGSSSNFGAPLANPSQAPGALLSLDPNGPTSLVVPSSFAAADGQASTLDGQVQLFSAQSPAFVNGLNTPGAATANLAGVSNPHGLSINNGFGRIWPANVPAGMANPGTESILDPNGRPLASAPNQQTGGVYAAGLTNRQPDQLQAGGLATAAVGTALLGRSPDKSTRAVFAIVCADGSIAQAHTGQAIDGLAPPGTITSLVAPGDAGTADLRVGVVLNFEPVRILYLSDPIANTVVAITLLDDGQIFHTGEIRVILSDSLHTPIGLAPAAPETEDTDWASNTTLAEGSDLYVANMGDNTIVRLRQDGSVVAVRQVTLPGGGSLGDAHLTGIATSADGTRIWVTVDGALPGFPGQDGAVLEVPACGMQ